MKDWRDDVDPSTFYAKLFGELKAYCQVAFVESIGGKSSEALANLRQRLDEIEAKQNAYHDDDEIIRVCAACSHEIERVGDDALDYCSNCESIEQPTKWISEKEYEAKHG